MVVTSISWNMTPTMPYRYGSYGVNLEAREWCFFRQEMKEKWAESWQVAETTYAGDMGKWQGGWYWILIGSLQRSSSFEVIEVTDC